MIQVPTVKSLDSFEFKAIPSLNKVQVLKLARCEWIERRENVIALEPSGTGKTHVAQGLGLAACQRGLSVRFVWYRAGVLDGEDGRAPRYLNAFGTVGNGVRPPATVEVNVAGEGPSNRIGGFFARDIATGTIYLMHAGWINPGGYAFREWVGEEQVSAFSGSGDPRFGFIVVPVNTATSGRSLIRYTESIAAFRQADDEVPAEAGQIRPFYREPRGRRVAHGPSVVEYLSRHSDVVDALRIWRQDRGMNPGCSIGKNKFIDMGGRRERCLKQRERGHGGIRNCRRRRRRPTIGAHHQANRPGGTNAAMPRRHPRRAAVRKTHR